MLVPWFPVEVPWELVVAWLPVVAWPAEVEEVREEVDCEVFPVAVIPTLVVDWSVELVELVVGLVLVELASVVAASVVALVVAVSVVAPVEPEVELEEAVASELVDVAEVVVWESVVGDDPVVAASVVAEVVEGSVPVVEDWDPLVVANTY